MAVVIHIDEYNNPLLGKLRKMDRERAKRTIEAYHRKIEQENKPVKKLKKIKS